MAPPSSLISQPRESVNQYVDWSILKGVGAVVDDEPQVALFCLFHLYLPSCFVCSILDIEAENVVLTKWMRFIKRDLESTGWGIE